MTSHETRHGEPSIFELLEPLSQALIDNGGPDIRTGFARDTGGVDIDWIVETLSGRIIRALAKVRGVQP